MHTIRSAWAFGRPQAPETLDVMTFTLGGQEYGVDLTRVRELRSYDPVIRIPGAPPVVRGEIDLLGTRVPVVDMRIALGFDTPVPGDAGDVIVFNIDGDMAGVAVDDVVDVVTFVPGQIAPPPASYGPLSAGCLIGIGTLPGRKLVLVDIDNFLRSEELPLRGRLAA